MRKFSLLMDLENEILQLYQELIDEHNIDLEEAKDMMMTADQRALDYIKEETKQQG